MPNGFIIESSAVNLDRAYRLVEMYPDQVEFAMAKSLTRTGKRVQTGLENLVDETFDRPTPFIQRGWRTIPATKRNPVAEVTTKDGSRPGSDPARYLAPHVYGVHRSRKKHESELHKRGHAEPSQRLVPASISLDKYGNVRRGAVNRIAQELQGKGRYFVGTIKGHTGVWQRYGRGFRNVRLALALVDDPDYDKTLRVYERGDAIAREFIAVDFLDAMEDAIATAR